MAEVTSQGVLSAIARKNAGGVSYASYIDLDGTSDYVSTPDSATNSVTTTIDLIAKIAPSDWTPAANSTIISKSNVTGNQKSIYLELEPGGTLRINASSDGSASALERSSASTGFTDGTAHWVRATINTTTGDVKFYTSDETDYPASWSQLGSTQASSISGMFDSTADWILGGRDTGSASELTGKVYYGEVLNGIGGTAVARFNASIGSDPTYDNIAGETDWTNTGGTPG